METNRLKRIISRCMDALVDLFDGRVRICANCEIVLKTMLCLTLTILSVFSLAAKAEGVRQLPISINAQALEQVKIVLSKERTHEEYKLAMQTLDSLNPSGPAYVAQVLELMASDVRQDDDFLLSVMILLAQMHSAWLDYNSWIDFAGSPLAQSMHKNMRILLMSLPEHGLRPAMHLEELYDNLDLWDETDLPYLTSRIFKESWLKPKLGVIIKWFDKAPEQFKVDFADRTRFGVATKERTLNSLVAYSLMYRSKQLDDVELIRLFRLFLSDLEFGFVSENIEAKPLLNAVLTDLHQRLVDGDPKIAAVYNQLLVYPHWPSQKYHWKVVYDMKQWLADLKSGNLLINCENEISHHINSPGKSKPGEGQL